MIILNIEDPDNIGCHSGYASFEGKTVKEVLKEIKTYVKDKPAKYIGKGFGNKNSKICDCWEITINDTTYISGWIGHTPTYNHEYDNSKVKAVYIHGGWYSFYNFNIYTI